MKKTTQLLISTMGTHWLSHKTFRLAVIGLIALTCTSVYADNPQGNATDNYVDHEGTTDWSEVECAGDWLENEQAADIIEDTADLATGYGEEPFEGETTGNEWLEENADAIDAAEEWREQFPEDGTSTPIDC